MYTWRWSRAQPIVKHQQHRYGSYSRMLDMGGAPSSATTKSKFRMTDASKNCHIQAVCFDFEIITGSITKDEKVDQSSIPHETVVSTTKVEPDVGAIQQMANLLNIDLGGTTKPQAPKEDDLSLITGDRKESSGTRGPNTDIRAKYADKLHKRGVGLEGVKLAKSQVEENLRQGDAAGHLYARQIVKDQQQPSSAKFWMATTGTGRLLQYLTRRSIKIGLLPTPVSFKLEQAEQMDDIEKQLKDVVFDVLLKPQEDISPKPEALVTSVLRELELEHDPKVVLLVSDRDDYLRAAKNAGLAACRIRPPNARRGNVSTHYTVHAVPDVEQVLNEVNGVSFNAVLNR